MQVPALSFNPSLIASNKDLLYLNFNVQLVKDEYLLSNPLFQIEFTDTMMFMNQKRPSPQP